MKVLKVYLLIAIIFTGIAMAQDIEQMECDIQNLKCLQTKVTKGYSIDLNRKNSIGRTSLHYAVEARDLELVKLILQYDNTIVSIADKQGNTALHRAVSLNQKPIAEVLLQNYSEINQVDRNGETSLDLANSNGYTELADYLVSKGGEAGKGSKKLTTIWVYGIYILLSIAITIWVARTLSTNGRVFLIDAFHNQELADSVNHLLVVGFYLINLGYITIALKIGIKPIDSVEALEILSYKIGFVILLLGAMHFFNLYLFGRLRKRTLLKRELGIEENVAVVKPRS